MTTHPANTPASGGGDLHREALFLLDRLREFEDENLTDENASDWLGFVKPSISRLAAVAAQPPKADGGVVPAKNPKAEIPPEGSEERAFWLEAAEQHGFEETSGGEEIPEYDPPAYFATQDEVLKLLSVARQQGWEDALAAAPPLNTGPEVGGGSAVWTKPASPEALAEIKAGMQSIQDFAFPGYVSFDGTYHGPSPALASAPADAGEDLAGLSAGQAAYRGYCSEVDEDPDRQPRMMPWDTLSDEVKRCWAAAEKAARLTPAASRPVEQGDPVAWEWEYLGVSGTWALELGRERPTQAAWRRNIRPLYAHPAPAASRPAVGRDNGWQPIETAPKDGRGLLLCVAGYQPTTGVWGAMLKEPQWLPFDPEGMFESDQALEETRKGSSYRPTHWQPIPETSSFSDPRDDTRAGGDQAERRAGEIIQRAAKRIEELEAEGAFRGVETNAARDVLYERRRQTEEEGWTPEHDDAHGHGEMATAAACYAYMSPLDDHARKRIAGEGAPYRWPWHPSWWKPVDPRRDLVKAGALILAEIERLDRAAAAELGPKSGGPDGRPD